MLVTYQFHEDKRRIDLQIMGSNRVFVMRSSNTHQYQQWVENLKFSIDSSIGAKLKISLESYRYTDEEKQTFKFHRFLRMLEDVFLDQAETGDLLLCSNKKKFSIQQMKKPSHVDRVFVIFKLNEANNQAILSERDKLHILRICGVRKGIVLEKWSDFKIYC